MEDGGFENGNPVVRDDGCLQSGSLDHQNQAHRAFSRAGAAEKGDQARLAEPDREREPRGPGRAGQWPGRLWGRRSAPVRDRRDDRVDLRHAGQARLGPEGRTAARFRRGGAVLGIVDGSGDRSRLSRHGWQRGPVRTRGGLAGRLRSRVRRARGTRRGAGERSRLARFAAPRKVRYGAAITADSCARSCDRQSSITCTTFTM